ncbi:MAG: hypothetical protein AVDCRST_MAG01-01-2421 [uncultured Rubrobacteraceae bacterium]|uniref:Uncharacterized protein n=1 Tax=uncultured Rubrobacteraceae bacterium TaxID=349277 RepID=A0A6J4PZ04_9ACTN|nr:MAG: hypothetical protein AVDCRST_MAG01-01-2421 [uncultured Rubrobacteraceae bacterium]
MVDLWSPEARNRSGRTIRAPFIQDRGYGFRRTPLLKLSDKWLEDVPGLHFGGAQRRSGACSAPLSCFLGRASGPSSIYQTVSARSSENSPPTSYGE